MLKSKFKKEVRNLLISHKKTMETCIDLYNKQTIKHKPEFMKTKSEINQNFEHAMKSISKTFRAKGINDDQIIDTLQELGNEGLLIKDL